MAKHFMTALALVASAFVPGALATTSTQCSEVTAWAAIQNPSFESGTTGWDYEFDPSTTTTYNTNGSASLHLDTGLTSWIMSQTINNLLPRKTYTVSVDLLPYVNPQSGAAESCDLYLYHDVLSAQNFIVRKSVQTYTKNTNNWFTLSGTWTPAGSSGSLALYISCSPSNGGNVFNMYVDNFQATYTTSVCTTITSTPTPSSSAVQSSSAVIPSSSVVPSSSAIIPSSSVVPSSSAVIPSSSVVPSSSAVIPSSSAVRISSSSAVPSSSAVIPSSSTSSSSSISSSATTSGSSLTTTTTTATTSSTSLSANPTATATATALGSTTSTVFSTRTSTITACPTTITNCPARSTYVVTETIVVSTTVCPVTATAQPTGFSGGAGGASGAGGNLLSTSTLVSTRVVTITACPSTITNCPASQHTTYTTTEAIVTGTVVYTVTAGGSPGAGPTATIVPGTAVGAQPAPTSTSISVSPGQVSPGNGNGNGSGSPNTNPAAQPALPSTLKSSSSAIIPSTHAVSTTTTTAATHLYTGAAAPRLTLDTVLMAVPAALAVLAL